MIKWITIPDDKIISETIQALTSNGINAEVVEDGEAAKKRVLELIPEGSEVLTMTSRTLEQIGITEIINESGKYDSVRNKLGHMDREKDHKQMQRIGAAPDYTIGSTHAVTQDGKAAIASNTGSQLSAYSYGANHVIWVVSAKKITSNLDEALKRIYEHVLPLESERANKAYGITSGSNVSKLLIVNKEINPQRINMILVKEDLGF